MEIFANTSTLPRTHIEDYMRARFAVRGDKSLADALEPALIDLLVIKPRRQQRRLIASLLLAIPAFTGALLWMFLGKPYVPVLIHLLGIFLGLGLMAPCIFILWNYTEPSTYRLMKELETDTGKSQLLILLEEHQKLTTDRSDHTLVHQSHSGRVKTVPKRILTRKNCLNFLLPDVGDTGLVPGGSPYAAGRLMVLGEPPLAVKLHLNMPGKKMGPFLFYLEDDALYDATREATLAKAPKLVFHFKVLSYIRDKRRDYTRLNQVYDLNTVDQEAADLIKGGMSASLVEKIRLGDCDTFENQIVLP